VTQVALELPNPPRPLDPRGLCVCCQPWRSHARGGGSGGRTPPPPGCWPPGSPQGPWCRRGAMPGRQGRMSGTPPPRSSSRRAHSSLTACQGLRCAGYGRWRGGRAFGAYCFAGKLRSPAPLTRRPGSPGQLRGLDPYASPYASRYASPYAGHLRTPSPPGRGITAGHAPSWGQSAAKTAADWPPSGGVERPRRVVRFARLIHRRGRVLGGPAVRAASAAVRCRPLGHSRWCRMTRLRAGRCLAACRDAVVKPARPEPTSLQAR